MMAQQTLGQALGGGGGGDPDDCPHPDESTYEYVASGRHAGPDGHRERRVYCNACLSVIGREAVPIGGGD